MCASLTSENTLREFPLVIATVAKVSRKHGLWLVVRVNEICHERTFCCSTCTLLSMRCNQFLSWHIRFFYISLQIQIDELEVIIILCLLLNRS